MNEMAEKINYLEKLINAIQNNVNFSIGLTWTILGVVFAILGLTGYFLIKILFNKRFEEEIRKIDSKIKNIIAETPPILYFEASTGTVISIQNEINEKIIEIHYSINSKISDDLIIKSEFYYEIDNTIYLLSNYILKVEGNGVKIKFKAPKNLDLNKIGFFIMWRNSIYYKK